MPCYSIRLGNGSRAIVCGRLGKHCSNCRAPAGFACDYPVGGGKTCDAPMCADHAVEVARNRHVCLRHECALQDDAAKPFLLEETTP